jgi:hypothetical protein
MDPATGNTDLAKACTRLKDLADGGVTEHVGALLFDGLKRVVYI